ncbi:hypothetical protein I305_04864 [Cryptococcus gattii E566]|nr:hypothetical protein I305_04864 [Cryptococcus gattii E566]KJE00144.1 hypothetical protein I311_06246 [Cryptococcus gattii NT-10]
MSRLPQIATPGRPSPTTGIPTPTARRPRSSLGPGQSGTPVSDDLMDRAFQDALRNRPPISLRSNDSTNGLSESTMSTSHLAAPSATYGLAAPRTPVVRPRTPSTLGLGAPVTPSAASRSASRAGLGPRSSLSTSTTAPFTPRRTSLASSTTSSTPFARRPESRASEKEQTSAKWVPTVGERVRISSMGYEGVLRFYGTTEFKEGVWAGVELEGGFKGKGKNDGTVEGVQYFSCPPKCGIFVTAVKLSPPTTGTSRPASVASSYRSTASYSLSGRATPSISGRATPSRPPSATPGRATRVVSTAHPTRPSVSSAEDETLPPRVALGNSTKANAGIDSRFTAGSRASRYVGMTAKQLDSARAGTTTPASKLAASTSTVNGQTPRVSRVSIGMGGTPARTRQSMGGLVTPRVRPRASGIGDMPPPPSPGNINRVLTARQVESLEEEIRELKRRNGELEEDLKRMPELRDEDVTEMETLRQETERSRQELEFLKTQLETSDTNATDAVKILEELQAEHTAQQEELEEKLKEIGDLKKELKLAKERAEDELAANAEARKDEVQKMLERAQAAEAEVNSMQVLVDDLTDAGRQMISLNESKQFELEERIRELEDKNRSLDEKLQKAREEHERALLPPSPSTRQREAATAAEIDNETLNAQVKHLQNKLNLLEEELEEARAQAETDMETWKGKMNRVKDGEKAAREEIVILKSEIKELKEQANGARGKIGELEGALKENHIALEGARAEIESLRTEAAEAASLRTTLQAANANEKTLSAAQKEIKEFKTRLAAATSAEAKVVSDAKDQISHLEAKIASLEAEITTLKQTAESNTEKNLSTSRSSEDAEKKLVGFQHIVQELSTENADLKEQCESLREEISLMKEEIKLLEEAAADIPGAQGDQKELLAAKATIKDLSREVAELEALIETKIYREDELESRAAELEREIERYKSSSKRSNGAPPHSATSATFSHASDGQSSSTATDGSKATREGVERCELCEGPHDLDACPVFAGNVSTEGAKKGGRWCADCESNEHDTLECPMAEDVF